MLSLKQLRYFEALSRLRHFGHAADECCDLAAGALDEDPGAREPARPAAGRAAARRREAHSCGRGDRAARPHDPHLGARPLGLCAPQRRQPRGRAGARRHPVDRALSVAGRLAAGAQAPSLARAHLARDADRDARRRIAGGPARRHPPLLAARASRARDVRALRRPLPARDLELDAFRRDEAADAGRIDGGEPVAARGRPLPARPGARLLRRADGHARALRRDQPLDARAARRQRLWRDLAARDGGADRGRERRAHRAPPLRRAAAQPLDRACLAAHLAASRGFRGARRDPGRDRRAGSEQAVTCPNGSSAAARLCG